MPLGQNGPQGQLSGGDGDLQSTLGYSPKAVTACPGHQEGHPLQILQQLHTSALAHGFGLGIPQADLHFADVGLAQQ